MKKSAPFLFGLIIAIWILSGIGLFGEFLLDRIGIAKMGGQITTWTGWAFGLSTAALIIAKIALREDPNSTAPTRHEVSARAREVRAYTPPVKTGRSGDYMYDDVGVAIPPAANCFTDYSDMKIGDSLLLVPEPSNTYDPKAVALYHGAKRIGYLYRGRHQEMFHDFDRRGDLIEAHISKLPPRDELKINLDFTRFLDIDEDEIDEDEHEHDDFDDLP